MPEVEKDLILSIEYDDARENPYKVFDQIGTIITWHRRLDLGGKMVSVDDYETAREFVRHEIGEPALVLPLYYDEHGPNCRIRAWDPDTLLCEDWYRKFVGVVYLTMRRMREEYLTKRLNAKTRAIALRVLQSEVEELSDYLNGDIYGYRILREVRCDLGHLHMQVVEGGMWGFYGRDIDQSGIRGEIAAETWAQIKEIRYADGDREAVA